MKISVKKKKKTMNSAMCMSRGARNTGSMTKETYTLKF